MVVKSPKSTRVYVTVGILLTSRKLLPDRIISIRGHGP